MSSGFQQIIAASVADRADLYLAAARRIGTPIGNIEKDFWICWTLEQLFHRLPAESPRLLFKGGTSLSKAHGLIRRFSEDIDISVFRDDLGESHTVAQLETLSAKKRQVRLDALRDMCRAFISGPLRAGLQEALHGVTDGQGTVRMDSDDPDGQTVLLAYPSVTSTGDPYVRPVVRIESGAKSALDPHRPAVIRPFVADDIVTADLTVRDVTTIEPTRTFWDKVVIIHGLRRWFERRGLLRQEGQRVSRHYYDLFCLLESPLGPVASRDLLLGADCVRHARLFFDRPDYDLRSASIGAFALTPTTAMRSALLRDYQAMSGMIFGRAPAFDDILDALRDFEQTLVASAVAWPRPAAR